VFYEMLAGRRPFQGKADDEHLQHTESAEVQPPRQFVDSIPRELERICLKALSHKVSDRFATAADFAEAIEQWTQGSKSTWTDVPAVNNDSTTSSMRWRAYGQLPGGPSLAVLPFTTTDDNAKGLATGLTEEINALLAKFKDLFILGRRVTEQYAADQRGLCELGQQLGVDYLLVGSVRRSTDQLRVTPQLVETQSSKVLWSETFRGNLSTHGIFEIEDEISIHVISALGLHDGVIAQSRLRSFKGGADDIDAFDSVTRFYQYLGSPEAYTLHPQVRAELEKTVEKFPAYVTARAALASVYLSGYLFNLVGNESRDDLLGMAKRASREAVETAPDNSLALEVLFRYDFHMGNREAFMDGVERAIQANPNDANMLANAGICLGFLGEMGRALPLTRKAIAMSPNPPGWYYSPEYWNGLLSEDYEIALTFARRYGSVSFWGPAIRAVSLGHLGRIEEAQQEWEQVVKMNPRFMEDFKWEMKAWHVNEALQNASLAGLAKAGLIPV